MPLTKTLLGILYVGLILSYTLVFVVYIELKERETVILENNILLNRNNYNMTKINGYYSTSGYYCVWTGNTDSNSITETELHEQCHYIIHTNRQHYCGVN